MALRALERLNRGCIEHLRANKYGLSREEGGGGAWWRRNGALTAIVLYLLGSPGIQVKAGHGAQSLRCAMRGGCLSTFTAGGSRGQCCQHHQSRRAAHSVRDAELESEQVRGAQ